jgi:pimeloyl-ACP methyl ester carboxylesterase
MNKQLIELSKYTAAYTSRGEGIPVILLHGFFGDCWTLGAIAQELASSYRCISLDLLGFGDSSKPDIRYRIEYQVELLQEFIAAQQISKFYLIGYSYGAWIASAYAIALADQILANPAAATPELAQLILLAPAGIRDDDFVGRHNYLRPLLWQTPLVEITLKLLAPWAKLAGQEKFFKSIQDTRQILVDQPVARSLLVDSLDAKYQDAIETVENDIDRVPTPTLVIAGEKDQTIPLWHAQAYADRLPQGSLQVIRGAEHDLVNSHSPEVAQAITNYWQRSTVIATPES